MSHRNYSRYPHLLRLIHWVLTVSLVILILTGLSLHVAARPEWSILSGVLPSWLWQGRVYVWHYWAAVAFLPALVVSLVFAWQRRSWLRPTHVILLGGAVVAAVTGVWMMFPFGSFSAIKIVVGLHAAAGLVVLPAVFLWHLIEGLARGIAPLVSSFRPLKNPQWMQVAAFVPVALVTTWIMFEGWPLHPPWRNLVVTRIEPVPAADIGLAGLPWMRASPLNIRLLNGSGFYSGQSDLTLQALHDGRELYVKAVWLDPVANHDYWPWKRTRTGWEYLQTSAKDETVHYEDKFSMIFPLEPSWHFEQVGCAISCHLDGSYGWGYKGGQPNIDVWHWKSVRTDPVGQVDDKYWSEVDFNAKDVGRHGDPKVSGGYVKNVSEDGSCPLYLPDEISVVDRGAILEKRAVPYSAELDEKFEPGTIIPGIVCAPFAGDRGDVTCVSKHEGDRWTLYLRRQLDTGSEFDVRFDPGGVYPFGCAAFDHAAKRHAYSMPVFRLVLEE